MKKKCLLILPRHLFPTVGGYAIKTINVAKILCAEFDTKIVVVSEQPITDQERAFYETHAVEYCYFSAPKWRFYLNALIGLISSRPIQCAYFSFGKVRRAVQRMGADVDLAVATIIRMVPYLEQVKPQSLRVIDMVDSIGLNYTRSAEKTVSSFWRMLYKIEAKRLMRYESQSVARADLTWYVNREEAQHWADTGPTLWTPMAVKEFLFDYRATDPQYQDAVAFFGKMDYQPNVDALMWYYENVHTRLANAPRLIVVGADPGQKLRQLAKQDGRITLTGFVDDPYLILNSVRAIVAPMQTGGGMQNKVLETMALGKVNILSTLAAEPIQQAVDGVHLLVANTPEEYAAHFALLDDATYCTQIGQAAKELISNNYRYDTYKATLLNSIHDLR